MVRGAVFSGHRRKRKGRVQMEPDCRSATAPFSDALRSAAPFFLAALALAIGRPAAADTFTETYYLVTGGLAVSEIPGNDFKDHSPGPDMLPYTADDEELPPGGNTGGTW